MTAIYSGVHFLVDLACAYLMFSGIYGTEEWYLCLLLYNFCAFAMQMPLGAFADGWNRNAKLSALGCVLIAAAFLPGAACPAGGAVLPAAAAATAGIGNGMFHVGGGLDVLNKSEKNTGLLGVFVAPGALGLMLGTLLGKASEETREWPALLLLAAAAAVIWEAKREKLWAVSGNRPVSYREAVREGAAAGIACLFLVVALRSYLGMIQDFTWKDSLGAGVFLVCATALGKMAGGFLADLAGVKRTAVVSVALAGALYLFSGHPVAGILAVFFWNMTMPLTLWAVARFLPGAKGFSFGLLTFALFLGFCPVYVRAPSALSVFPSAETGLGVLCLFSLALLVLGLRGAKR